jgi:hypothetical protein
MFMERHVSCRKKGYLNVNGAQKKNTCKMSSPHYLWSTFESGRPLQGVVQPLLAQPKEKSLAIRGGDLGNAPSRVLLIALCHTPAPAHRVRMRMRGRHQPCELQPNRNRAKEMLTGCGELLCLRVSFECGNGDRVSGNRRQAAGFDGQPKAPEQGMGIRSFAARFFEAEVASLDLDMIGFDVRPVGL